MHNHVEDVHEAGLVDGCRRCAEHAEQPIRELDERMLASLVRSAVARSGARTAEPYEPPASTVHTIAETVVLNVLERVGRLAEVAPGEVARYLRDRWNLEVEIVNPRAGEVEALRRTLEGE